MRIKFLVVAFLVHQQIVCALLNDLSLIQDNDLIGVLCRRYSMTYNKCSSVSGCFFQVI